ncbi:LuxR C-terminal-related transcriptional regulator [Altericista sp. CCNU0014]|uniref:LuxR C-terminal-related transcriptional regulator n=1 Tax=Altericista sp. CCNU0014 TaxID=3082949 RepID=UPI0038506D2A
MSIFLKLLFEEIYQTKDEDDLRSRIVPKIGEYFSATRWGIFFFDDLQEALRKYLPLADRTLLKTMQMGLSIEHNPVVRYLVERHAPVHEALVASPKVWTLICPRPDHWHAMAGPIVSNGRLIGAVGCTRERAMPAFDTQNLVDMSAVCLHLSAWASTVRSQRVSDRKSQYQVFKADCLTPRELQIAGLVALGRTNAEIGTELWIAENSVKQALKRMFRKLEVSSRAEMVARLFATQYHPPSLSRVPSSAAQSL